jgi:hypothetical protein
VKRVEGLSFWDALRGLMTGRFSSVHFVDEGGERTELSMVVHGRFGTRCVYVDGMGPLELTDGWPETGGWVGFEVPS